MNAFTFLLHFCILVHTSALRVSISQKSEAEINENQKDALMDNGIAATCTGGTGTNCASDQGSKNVCDLPWTIDATFTGGVQSVASIKIYTGFDTKRLKDWKLTHVNLGFFEKVFPDRDDATPDCGENCNSACGTGTGQSATACKWFGIPGGAHSPDPAELEFEFSSGYSACTNPPNTNNIVPIKGIKFFAIHPGGGGDPHITNIAGEKFDILSEGTFEFLSLAQKSFASNAMASGLLKVDATIVRVDPHAPCKESFIQNMTLSGSWVTQMGYELLQLRANASSIEVGFDGHWQAAATLSSAEFKGSSKVLVVKVGDVTLSVDIKDYHNKEKEEWQKLTRRFGWSFLNVKVDGLLRLSRDIYVGGLLGYDDHSKAMQKPEKCENFMEGPHPNFVPFRSKVEVS